MFIYDYKESDINKDKERIEDDSLSDQGSPDQPNNEISISLLRAKNLSLLQSQYVQRFNSFGNIITLCLMISEKFRPVNKTFSEC